jgi:subtilisin family serine protease
VEGKTVERVIVLRDIQRARVIDPFGTGTRQVGLKSEALFPPELRIEVETTDQAGRADLLRDREVVAVTTEIPTTLVTPRAASGDGGGTAWGIAATGADRSSFTGEDVVVAVLDTGIDRDHPAFAGVTLVEEDFSGCGNGDRQGHGTHCAGTVFGRDVDGVRIGVARGVTRALIGKVLDDGGGGGSEMLFRGLDWAATQGAHVISMSLGFDFPGQVRTLVDGGWPADLATSRALEAYRGNVRMFDSLMSLIRAREAFGAGSVVVAAAGNESRRDENEDFVIAASLPAAAEGVISVGAVGESGHELVIGPFSNAFPVLCGPGVDIRSARTGGGLTALTGTSTACPHVAGAAALWWEEARSSGLPLRARTVAARLMATARTDRFAAATSQADRGVGMVTAP